MSKTKNRNDIDNKYKWKIEDMYPDENKWDEDLKLVEKMVEDFACFSGKLGESSEVLLSANEEKDEIWLLLEKIYVYARMKKTKTIEFPSIRL